MRRRALVAALVLASAVAVAVPLAAVGRQAVFHAVADSVVLDVAVSANGKPVAGLTAADFQVFDNGVRQRILDISRDSLPIDVTLAIDVSESEQGSLLESLTSAANKVRARLRAGDRVSVLTFNERVRERQPLADVMSVGRIALGPASGMTSIHDALVVALAEPTRLDRRQMIIVFTDGLDTSSFLDDDAVFDAAGRASTAIFAVTTAVGKALSHGFLASLTDHTGGTLDEGDATIVSSQQVNGVATVVFNGGSTGIDLDRSFLRAIDDFRTRYVIRYGVDGVPRDGWHRLTVLVAKPGTYVVRARSGYMGS